MSFLRAKKAAGVKPDYTGLQLQTSVSTLPIPIVWGQTKAAANVIWYNNFKTIPQSTKSAGKGGSSSVVSYDYSASLIMALCEGPIAGIGQIWKDQSIYTLSSLGLTLVNGASPQSVWGYLTSSYPSQALAYNGTAFVCAANYALGSSADVGNHNFEIIGLLAGTGINGLDADPAQVISDFLTNPQYGVGFPASSINAASLFAGSGSASLQTYCRAIGLAFSPALATQEQASSILQRWLQILNCAAVWSGGQLKFIPYGDSPASGNGATFAPDVTPIYDLADDDFLAAGKDADPLLVSRVDPYSLPTIQRIEICDRGNQYGTTPIEARDQSQIDLYGPRVGTTITAHEICDPTNIAPIVAQTILQRLLYVRAHFSFKLSFDYCLLEPMDIVTLTDANLGLTKFPVRIISIEEDGAGALTVTAEEFTAGLGVAALYPTATPTSTVPNQGAEAEPVNPPLIFEPPATLTGGVAQIWLGASGGANGQADPNWGGAYVWLSLDNVAYTLLATINQPLRQGSLTAALAAASGWDATNTLSLTLAESAGVLSGATQTSAEQGVTLSLVDSELLAYESAALTAPSAYNLTGLARGLEGAPAAAHASGAPFARLDGAIVKYDLPQGYVGQTLYLKFQSFNVFGAGVQSLADCAVYPYTPKGSGGLGPVAQALAVGGNLDYGLASLAAGESDDFGLASDPYATVIDLGLASD